MLALAMLAAVLPAFVASQSVPGCALTCTISLASSSACGGLTNVTCLCTDQDFQAKVFQCYTNTCSEADLQAAIAYGAQTCQSVGVTLNTSATPAGVTGSAASTGAASASSVASSDAALASSVASSLSASAASSAAPAASASPTGGAAGALVRGNALVSTVAAVVGVAGLAVLL